MQNFDLLLRGGSLVFPDRGECVPRDLAVRDGRILFPEAGQVQATRVLDASGLLVAPGFVDLHMHDEEMEDPHTVERALLLQGVTTALAGNCGSGPLLKRIRPHRTSPWLHLGYLTGHRVLREEVGLTDVYLPALPGQIDAMKALLREELRQGSFGLSFGLEYAPHTSSEEIRALAEELRPFPHRWIPVHIRYDGPRCLEAVQEVLDLALETGLRFDLSHFGSMTAFGFTRQALELVEAAWEKGADVTLDCYPYDAFCTHVGSAVFDPGFEERWGKGVEALEAGSGRYRGRRLTPETFAELRRDDPEALVIAHVLNGSEVRECLRHPRCALASDAVLHQGQGHPRAAGTFPRGLRLLREEGLSWPEAIRHATSLPAEMGWLDAGRLEEGAPADLVVFDPERLADRATFQDQLLPPEGIAYVVLRGQVAVDHGTIDPVPRGSFLLR